jgi:hypothetical protein
MWQTALKLDGKRNRSGGHALNTPNSCCMSNENWSVAAREKKFIYNKPNSMMWVARLHAKQTSCLHLDDVLKDKHVELRGQACPQLAHQTAAQVPLQQRDLRTMSNDMRVRTCTNDMAAASKVHLTLERDHGVNKRGRQIQRRAA